jgi:hypothetical protein
MFMFLLLLLLQVLQEMLDMLRDHQQNHHSARLEWIIIWLIAGGPSLLHNMLNCARLVCLSYVLCLPLRALSGWIIIRFIAGRPSMLHCGACHYVSAKCAVCLFVPAMCV